MAYWLVRMNVYYKAHTVVKADTKEEAMIIAENLEGSLETDELVDWDVTSAEIINKGMA
jgi:hypothetical protein